MHSALGLGRVHRNCSAETGITFSYLCERATMPHPSHLTAVAAVRCRRDMMTPVCCACCLLNHAHQKAPEASQLRTAVGPSVRHPSPRIACLSCVARMVLSVLVSPKKLSIQKTVRPWLPVHAAPFRGSPLPYHSFRHALKMNRRVVDARSMAGARE